MDAASGAELVGELAAQLKALDTRGYHRVFETVHGHPALDLPDFFEAVRRISGDTQVTTDTIRLVLDDAVAMLGNESQNGLTLRAAARALFLPNLEAIDAWQREDDRRQAHKSAVLALLHEQAPREMKDSVLQAWLHKVRAKLAHELVRQAYPDLFVELADEQPESALPTLVPRPAIEWDLRTALSNASTPIYLWGESGNGKSTLARQVVAQDSTSTTVWLRPGSTEGSDFDLDLTAELLRRRVGVARLGSFTSRLNALRDILAGPSSKVLFIFDDLDRELGLQLLERDIDVQAKVLVTQRGEPPADIGTAIRVSEYEDRDTAVAAAQLVLPAADETDLISLVATLGRRPVAIDIACNLIALGENTIGEVIQLAEVDPRGTLDDAMELVDETYSESIARVYKLAAEAVRRDPHGRASAVLNVLLWLRGRRSESFVGLTCRAIGLLQNDLAVRSGIRKLRRLGLIQIRDDHIEINDLTIALLRQEFVNDLQSIIEPYYRIGLKALPDLPAPFGRMDPADYSTVVDRANADPLDMFRLGQGMQVRRALWINRLLDQQTQAGSIFVGGEDYIIWQHGRSWFRNSNDGYQFALVTSVSGDDYLIWHPNRQPERAGEPVSNTVRGYKYAQQAGIRVTRRVFGRPLDANMSPENYLDVDPQDADGVEHRWVSLIPAEVAARYSLPIWADCGQLIVPPTGKPISRCPRCHGRAADSDQQIRESIAYLTTILNATNCFWPIGTSMVSAMLTRHSGETWDVGWLDLMQELVVRSPGISLDVDLQRLHQRIYQCWFQLAVLDFAITYGRERSGVDLLALYESLATLRRWTLSALHPSAACLFARNNADLFRLAGTIADERLALEDALEAASRYPAGLIHQHAIRHRLATIADN